jgi:CobQ-like glutamine amidotransferase family enzyme
MTSERLARNGRMRPSAVRIAVLYPELLGLYGDAGNALALSRRLLARGIDAELVEVSWGTTVPLSCDIYLLGGSEDGPQEYAVEALAGAHLERAVDADAAVVAVCSGLQMLGREFPGRDGRPVKGLGLLPCRTIRAAENTQRTVGDVILRDTAFPGLGDVVGFENHAGQTVLDPGAHPFGRCVRGVGNRRDREPEDRVDGVVLGSVLGSYLHGPILALNPALADAVLSWVTGPLAAVDDAMYNRRVAAARRRRTGGPSRSARNRPRAPVGGSTTASAAGPLATILKPRNRAL